MPVNARTRIVPTTFHSPDSVEHDTVPGSRGERALQGALGTGDRAAAFYRDQVSAVLTPRMQAFISRIEMFWIATSDDAGRCGCSFRSGPPGFVRVLSADALAYPDYRGNGVMASSGNLLENPHIGMWFGDFEHESIGLHVNGLAEVLTPEQMRAADSEFPEPSHPGRMPTHWVGVLVEEAYVHCRKNLPRLIRQTGPRSTDVALPKAGDYFGVAASQSMERSVELRHGPLRLLR